MRWYLDTSAALKLAVAEAETAALVAAIDHERPELVASILLETEMRRAAARAEELSQGTVSHVLDGISLFEMARSTYWAAGVLPGRHLRSLDALHLATASTLDVDAVVTYDLRMADAAESLGLTVLAPGLDAG
ncbi:VapC toxin family PIN domain ribonuclease [Kocuria polaris]|nr:VapC toxin family PIN domain ribonuclease [Kocuria polaris]